MARWDTHSLTPYYILLSVLTCLCVEVGGDIPVALYKMFPPLLALHILALSYFTSPLIGLPPCHPPIFFFSPFFSHPPLLFFCSFSYFFSGRFYLCSLLLIYISIRQAHLHDAVTHGEYPNLLLMIFLFGFHFSFWKAYEFFMYVILIYIIVLINLYYLY